MTRRAFPWDRLGIDPTSDKAAIRKAYADILRATNLDDDIAGYAELRRARDAALWQAGQGKPVSLRAVPPATESGEGAADDIALPDDAQDADRASPGDPPREVDGDDWQDDDWDEDDDWDDSPSAQHPDPLTRWSHGGASAQQETEAQAAAKAAWGRLLAVLYPGGQPSEDAVTHAELGEGLAAVDTLIARAEEADLAEHDALDTGLADLFASTWPRSAPFVEPASTAFGWLDEAGALEERYALRFLNDRIKGMRFHEKVQMPAHPLNRAWTELSRPGPARLIDRLRVKRLEVHKLLTGIRQRYPELESHLDPERVASWEGRVDGPSSKVAVILLLLIFAALFLRACPDGTDDRDGGALVPIAIEQGPSAAEIDARVAAIFGQGTDLAALEAADKVFADRLQPLLGLPANRFLSPVNYVRLQALGAGEVARGDVLIARAGLKALWLRAALRQSPETCSRVARGNLRNLDLGLAAEEQRREHTLLRQLLNARVLGHEAKGGEVRYEIPGWLVEDVLKRSRLTEKRLVAALGDPENQDRCTVEIALLDAVLAAPSRVPAEVLKGI